MKKTMIALATLLTFSASGVSAAEISVAVAANFTAPIKEISAIYEKESGRLSTKVSVSTLNPTPSESWFSGAQQIISSNKIPTSSSPTPLRKSRLPIRS